jgi:hypothetical protein
MSFCCQFRSMFSSGSFQLKYSSDDSACNRFRIGTKHCHREGLFDLKGRELSFSLNQ